MRRQHQIPSNPCKWCLNHGNYVQFNRTHWSSCPSSQCNCRVCRPHRQGQTLHKSSKPASGKNQRRASNRPTGPTPTAGSKGLQDILPPCAYCKNHGSHIYSNGQHSKFCRFRNCPCDRCIEVRRGSEYCTYCKLHKLSRFSTKEHIESCSYRKRCSCELCEGERGKHCPSDAPLNQQESLKSANLSKPNVEKAVSPTDRVTATSNDQEARPHIEESKSQKRKRDESPPLFQKQSRLNSPKQSAVLSNCPFCSNHNWSFPLKEHHSKVCMFKQCECKDCKEQRRINRAEKKLDIHSSSILAEKVDCTIANTPSNTSALGSVLEKVRAKNVNPGFEAEGLSEGNVETNNCCSASKTEKSADTPGAICADPHTAAETTNATKSLVKISDDKKLETDQCVKNIPQFCTNGNNPCDCTVQDKDVTNAAKEPQLVDKNPLDEILLVVEPPDGNACKDIAKVDPGDRSESQHSSENCPQNSVLLRAAEDVDADASETSVFYEGESFLVVDSLDCEPSESDSQENDLSSIDNVPEKAHATTVECASYETDASVILIQDKTFFVVDTAESSEPTEGIYDEEEDNSDGSQLAENTILNSTETNCALAPSENIVKHSCDADPPICRDETPLKTQFQFQSAQKENIQEKSEQLQTVELSAEQEAVTSNEIEKPCAVVMLKPGLPQRLDVLQNPEDEESNSNALVAHEKCRQETSPDKTKKLDANGIFHFEVKELSRAVIEWSEGISAPKTSEIGTELSVDALDKRVSEASAQDSANSVGEIPVPAETCNGPINPVQLPEKCHSDSHNGGNTNEENKSSRETSKEKLVENPRASDGTHVVSVMSTDTDKTSSEQAVVSVNDSKQAKKSALFETEEVPDKPQTTHDLSDKLPSNGSDVTVSPEISKLVAELATLGRNYQKAVPFTRSFSVDEYSVSPPDFSTHTVLRRNSSIVPIPTTLRQNNPPIEENVGKPASGSSTLESLLAIEDDDSREVVLCEVCGKNLPSLANYRQHGQLHRSVSSEHRSKRYSPLIFLSPKAVVSEKPIKTGQLEEGNNDLAEDENIAEEKEDEESEEASLMCHVCGNLFPTAEQFRLHAYLKHNIDSESRGETSRCSVCEFKDEKEISALDHEGTHMGLVPLDRLLFLFSSLKHVVNNTALAGLSML